MKISFLLGLFGCLVLAHAAYATIQYRGVLKITEEEFSGPPVNVVVELLLGLGFCVWASLSVPGNFRSILPHSEENSVGQILKHGKCCSKLWEFPHIEDNRQVSLPANLDFMIFNHRIRAFPVNSKLKFEQ